MFLMRIARNLQTNSSAGFKDVSCNHFPLDAVVKTCYLTNVANNKAEYPLSPQRSERCFTDQKRLGLIRFSMTQMILRV